MLETLKVVEIGGGVAGSAAGDLFRRLGSDVTRVGPDSRVRYPEDGTMRSRLSEVLGRGKNFACADGLWDEATLEQISAANVVVVDVSGTEHLTLGSDCASYEDLVARHNPGSWVTISPFGLYGLRRGFLGTEITSAAAGGIPSYMRSSQGRPMKPAGFSSSISAGHFAVLAALHGVLLSKDSGRSVHLDLSIQDSVVATGVFLECSHELFECSGSAGSSRHGPPSGLIECASGLMWLMVVEDHQWKAFLRALDNPSWARGIESVKDREQNSDLLREEVNRWARQYSNQEAVARLQAASVPATAVNSCSDLVDQSCPDIRPGFFVNAAGVGELVPGLPFSTITPHRALHDGSTTVPQGPRPYRVLDVSNVLVGPLACSWLGAMGIDVLKVEDTTRLDVYRRRGPFPGGIPDVECGAYFASANYSKRSYAIPLDSPEGSRRLAELMASADLVITNVSAHRAANLGVLPQALDGYSTTVLISSGGFSQLAANAAYRCYGYNCHASGGLVHLSRDRECHPCNLLTAWADPLTSIWIATLAIAQLLRPTAEREHMNLSMTEVVACEFPEFFSALTRDGVEVTAMENRVDHAAPHGIYRCAGDEKWIAIAIESEEQWQRLVAALGEPADLMGPTLGSMAGRLRSQDQLDVALEKELVRRDRDEMFEALQRAGVPCAPVYSARELVADEHLQIRGLFQTVEHPRWGRRALTGLPWRIVGEGPVEISATPLLGAHTANDPSEWWPVRERKH